MISLLKKKIATVMQDSRRHSLFSFAALLNAAAHVYGTGLAVRHRRYRSGQMLQYRLPCRVISIGNLTTGGTGKTPMTIKTAALLQQMGLQVVVISRGYKGSAEKKGGMVSDGKQLLMDSAASGDEPFMLASALPAIPVLVGADRCQAGRLAVSRFQPDVILLDDAFQHFRLHRDLDLVLLDSEKPFGNGSLLPRGLLREAVDALFRADAVILTRRKAGHTAWPDFMAEDAAGESLKNLKRHLNDIPVFKSAHVPYACRVIPGREKSRPLHHQTLNNDRRSTAVSTLLKGRRLHAFSGIARNDAFLSTIESLQGQVVSFQSFQDHHAYSNGDLQRIVSNAQASQADVIVTTEKDYVRMADRFAFPMDLVVLGVEIEFTEGDVAFSEFLRKRLSGMPMRFN